MNPTFRTAALLLMAAAAPAMASDSPSPKQVISLPSDVREATRFVITSEGSLVVEPDGRVSNVKLDMPSSTREAYRQAISRWTFEPMRVNGEPVRAEARFTLSANGTAIPGTDQMQLAIENVWFRESTSLEGGEEHRPERARTHPPRYPSQAALAGYGGTVYVIVQLNGEGEVLEAGAASVSLSRSSIRNERQAESMARLLVNASVSAAREWVVADPDAIASGAAVIPVTFHPPQQSFGGWKPQIPLEVTPLPWMLTLQSEAAVLTAGGESSASRFKLVDDVAGSAVN
jgi:hypothetical protein